MTIVLNDSFVMILGLLVIFVLYDSYINHKLNRIFEDFLEVFGTIDKGD